MKLKKPSLPKGAVSSLFTEVEGFTRLLNRLSGDYVKLVAEHHRLLRAAFAVGSLVP